MEIEGDYQRDGFALVRGMVPRGVARALMARLKADLPPGPLGAPTDLIPILNRPAVDIYGNDYPPMQAFLWALTPAMEAVTGQRLIPTYDYFRIYREGDICRIHRDRPACQHSLSMTLDYSDDVPWPLEVGTEGVHGPQDVYADDFGPEPNRSMAMGVGDAVAYRGVEHRHGRTTPNPNAWSAHLFLHWVDPNGPFADQAFDGVGEPKPVNFTFAEGLDAQ
ncbi:MAG: hypothetical protein LH610_06000 [Sphingomonas bacterium]|nr:hypothetical protein [Sphingomonas bacterium]